MSLYNKASLVLIPSGTKTGKVYSQKPTDGDGDFDFTRSSYATRVNSQGLIEKERGNLLLQSNSFDTTWVNSGTITRTSGQSGYDGSNDAWLLTKGSAGAFIRQTNSQSGVYTFSVYAKADTSDWLLLDIDGSPDAFQYFDLGNGVLGASGTNVDATITSVGGSWYRCSVTGADTYTEVRIYPAEGNNNVGGTTTQLYIQDAQLEQGLVATDYIETTTAAVYTGITDNVPRLDYDGDCPSLLLEPQRTNLITYSEDFTEWTSEGGIDEVLNFTTSPEGLTNATKLELTATDGKSAYYISSLSGDHTFSVFAKKGNHDVLYLWVGRTSGNITRWIDLENGVESGSGNGDGQLSIEDFGNNWFRISFTFDATDMTRVNLEVADSGQSTAQIGDNIYVYGAQLEEGSYATSYIPTYGTSVTRTIDKNVQTNEYTIAERNFTIFCDSLGELTASSAGWSLRYKTDSSKRPVFRFSSCVGFNTNSGTVYRCSSDLQLPHKVAISFDIDNDVAKLFLNGQQHQTDVTDLKDNLDGVSRAIIAADSHSSTLNYKVFAVFPEALTDQECIDLTT